MAISTMQQPRQNYGLGSFVKKITKKVTKPITKVASKIVPKEIAGIMRIAAPFLPPGYREAAYLLGTAKQTGRISPVDLALTLAPSANQFFAKDKSMPFFQRKGFFAEQFPKADAFLFGSPAETVAMEGPVMGTKQVEAGRFFTEGSPFQQTQKFTKTFDVPSSTAGFTKDIAATEGIFGTGGKSFKFGKGKGLGSFRDDTKLGQLLLGGKDKQGKPTGKFSLSKILGLGIGGLTLIQSAKTPEEAGENLAAATGNPLDRQRGEELFGMLDSDIFKIDDRFVLPAKDGGLMRTNYAMGSEDPKPLPEDPTKPINPFGPKPIGPVLPDRMADIPRDLNLEEAKEMFIKFTGREPLSMQELLEFFNVKEQAAEGGLMRENYALGSMPTAEESGLGGLPIEADMRYTGGFMPYGAKEKADDVPARLSKNEFVFTADAVRAAGGGSVQRGAQRMYNTMKQLESQPEAKGMA